MAKKAEEYRKQLMVVDFVAFGKQDTKYFFDTTVEQASKYIWKNICPTAVILFAWDYGVSDPKQKNIEKRKLNDTELQKMYKTD